MVVAADSFGCLGTSIKTVTGEYLDLVNPKPESINIRSIGMSLSKICRYGGQCPEFYSVAEHCFHCVDLAYDDGVDSEALKAIFLHDAAEAYIGDMVRPLKLLLPEFGVIEKRIEAAIEQKFNVSFSKYESEIKTYDRLLLKAEKMMIWPNDGSQWEGFDEIPLRFVKMEYWKPHYGFARYFEAAEWLGFAG